MVTKTKTPVTKTKIDNFPYFSQLDNANNPYGTCNVTSVAMCLAHEGIVGNGQGQLEDQLYELAIAEGLDLEKLIKLKGRKDKFKPNATWSDAKAWLIEGKPLIAHGYFTRSGHIVALVGFNEKGFIVNDPYGEYYATGYDTSASGKELTYSYEMMRSLCGEDGDLWLHFAG